MQVGEVAPSAAGDQNLSPRLRIVLDDEHSPPAAAGHRCAHQPGRSGPENDHIELARVYWHWSEKNSRKDPVFVLQVAQF
jgi:hypothetical protein